jgi:membrane-bound lytic murein transglycosylase D
MMDLTITAGSRTRARIFGSIRPLPVGAVAVSMLLVFGCASTDSPGPTEPTPPEAAGVDGSFLGWKESTQAYTDDLLAEARRLAELGDDGAALDRIDEALCAVLDPPEAFASDPAYLDFVAGLLATAETLEHSLSNGDDGAIEDREMVALPPIEIPELPPDAIEIVGPDGLPPSDYPLILNSTVDGFLDAMTAEGEYRNRIETGLTRAGDYLPMIRTKFRAAGLPEEISYLPLIESAFSVKAYSRARAHGMWQFMSATGRHYGLEVGSLVDERRDPVRSTEAAVAYLSDLYDQFDDWYLALAAYNSGAGNVRRAIRRSGSRDFWTLKRYLPRETRNYVPAFIASVIIAKDPAQWGFPVPDEKPWSFDRVDVPDALDLQFLADRTTLSVDELRRLNPAIRRDLTPANRTTALWVPVGDGAAVADVLAQTPRSDWAPRMIHTVRRGESLSTIAARYGSNVSAIKQANGLRRTLIHPGQSLIVPRFGEIPRESPARRHAENGSYIVQSNDTLWDIARAFGVSVDSLCAANGLSRRSVIRPGQRLSLPPNSASPAASPSRSSTTDGWTGRYTVRSGDTLSGIAARHRVSVTALRRANGLTTSRIYPGNTLTVPGATGTSVSESRSSATTYRVRKGDTLYDIARQFGVSVTELRRLNGLSTSRIYPGDVLKIPNRQAKG